MKKELVNAPVYYALVQARFNPIQDMDEYAGKIQDQLRRAGYPLHDEFEKEQELSIERGKGGEVRASIKEVPRWLMSARDCQSGFILGQSYISFHTTDYKTHENFIGELLKGLEIVNTVVELDHVSRLGLRYLDAVLPKSGECVEQYLTGKVHGVALDSEIQQSLSETSFNTDLKADGLKGRLVVRTRRAKDYLGFPPDMSPLNLKLKERFDSLGSIDHAIIDIDHYVDLQGSIDDQDFAGLLESLHSHSDIAFHAVATPHAFKVWS